MSCSDLGILRRELLRFKFTVSGCPGKEMQQEREMSCENRVRGPGREGVGQKNRNLWL